MKALIYLALTLVQCDKYGSTLFSSGRYPVFPETFVEEAVFPPSYVFDTFIKN
jgi:hypothetical protein